MAKISSDRYKVPYIKGYGLPEIYDPIWIYMLAEEMRKFNYGWKLWDLITPDIRISKLYESQRYLNNRVGSTIEDKRARRAWKKNVKVQ